MHRLYIDQFKAIKLDVKTTDYILIKNVNKVHGRIGESSFYTIAQTDGLYERDYRQKDGRTNR